MSVRFVPIACPSCGGDATGRARDVAAFCRRCGTAFLTGPSPSVIDASRVAGEADLLLPFWVLGPRAAPAFLSSRPLTLAHLASRARTSWREVPLRRGAPPYGARLAPESLAEIARIARLPGEDEPGAARLAAVPARFSGGRWFLPGVDVALVPDDVVEADALRGLATVR